MLSLRPFCFLLAACLWLAGLARAQETVGGLKDVPFFHLSDRNLAQLGQAALSIRPGDWKHAETTNFIYHYFTSQMATPVSVEAEFYYRIIAKEMEKDTTRWERKSHIFVFESPEDWAAFQRRGTLDPWTGGLHARGELFIVRNPHTRFQGNTLGHEVAHLVVDRFFGSNVPLWLNEGYAEYVSLRGYAAFQRARNYRARPMSPSVAAASFVPLKELTEALSYPQDVLKVEAFYRESEKLARFLSATNKQGFGVFFEALSKGARFETALSKGFGGRFPNIDALEREFKAYATNENGVAQQD